MVVHGALLEGRVLIKGIFGRGRFGSKVKHGYTCQLSGSCTRWLLYLEVNSTIIGGYHLNFINGIGVL